MTVTEYQLRKLEKVKERLLSFIGSLEPGVVVTSAHYEMFEDISYDMKASLDFWASEDVALSKARGETE